MCLRGRPVWHGADDATGFEWTWIELLEFLSGSWLYLAIKDGAPLGVALGTAHEGAPPQLGAGGYRGGPA